MKCLLAFLGKIRLTCDLKWNGTEQWVIAYTITITLCKAAKWSRRYDRYDERGWTAQITISVNNIKIHQIHDVMHSTLHKSRKLCIQHVFIASRSTAHALANRAQSTGYSYGWHFISFPYLQHKCKSLTA